MMMAKLLLLLCATAILNCSQAFNVAGRAPTVSSRTCITISRSPLYQRPKRTLQSSLLHSAPDDTTATTNGAPDEDNEDDEEESRGLLKILFISVPLFCKFCIVLMVKFLTDLVVYPLLILYRLARLTKQRFFKLLGINKDKTSKT